MTVVVHSGSTPLEIWHEDSSTPDAVRTNNVITARDCEPNVMTTIAIGGARVAVYWDDGSSSSMPPHVLFVPETSVLFIGAGTLVVTLSVPTMKVIDRNDATLFWSFTRDGEYVLHCDELECNLYSIRGHRLSTAPVDPPYDIERTAAGYRLTSSIFGEHWLRFPATQSSTPDGSHDAKRDAD